MNLLLFPIAEISEIIDQTQTAVAGWRSACSAWIERGVRPHA